LLFDQAWNSFDDQVDGWSEQMKFSYLLANNKYPTLILYGTGDALTPHALLEEEIEGQYHVVPIMFKGAGHVRIYTEPEFKESYSSKINEFLRTD
jgi:pimeloyl-ACP methyl ester carboxylesterase